MDAQTFQQEALKHEQLLYRISYAMLRSDADCADAVQKALLRAWKHRDDLRDMRIFKNWLCRILINAWKLICQGVFYPLTTSRFRRGVAAAHSLLARGYLSRHGGHRSIKAF